MSRRGFIEGRLGATCANWTWSWSFINHDREFVVFGAWDEFEDSNRQTILHEDWKTRGGRRAPGYYQALDHLNFVEDGYALLTFPMERSLAHPNSDSDTSKIKSFSREVQQRRLEKDGPRWLAVEDYLDDLVGETSSESERLWEGARFRISVNAIERNAKARAMCLAAKGFSCLVCDINFANMYGDIGRNFIHVHHRVPLKDVTDTYIIDPVNDLDPVCPNCHAMLHRRDPPFTVEELRELLK